MKKSILLLLLLLFIPILCGKDYYKILGISRDADDKDIKKSYRKLALRVYFIIIISGIQIKIQIIKKKHKKSL